jgi:hypothetical protein
VSLLVPTIWLVFILRITHAVDRILGDKDPVTLPLGDSTAPATQARAGSGTT